MVASALDGFLYVERSEMVAGSAAERRIPTIPPIKRTLESTSSAVIWGVLRRAPVVDELDGIEIPALVIVGDEDAATPPEKA